MNEIHYANAVCAAINANNAPAAVEIADVHANAVKVPTRDLAPGMTVWDIWGTEYTLDRVTHYTHGCRTRRSDGEVEWQDYRTYDDTERMFTVRRP